MSTEVTTLFVRGVPRDVVREAKAAAAREGSALATFVTNAVRRSLALSGTSRADESSLEASARWYEKNRARLSRKYRNQWIAILNRRVVDADMDWERLTDRMFDRFGPRSFFMPRVGKDGPFARLRSPRVTSE